MSSKEQLFHVLAEAAELEHNILCSYLYAAFSLKQKAEEDLSAEELRAVQGWREQLMGLCVEEMVHLAQVSNLLAAVGSLPHFNRPNLPVPPGYHPAGIAIKLSPLDIETLDHFIYLERPEEAAVRDAAPYAEPGDGMPRPKPAFDPLMPRAPEYETIGQFYEALRREIERSARQLGESRLFVGAADLQLQPAELNAPELVVVRDLAGARRAIDFIVEQGEGSSGDRDDSHFGRFEAIKAEYLRLQQARAGFVPHRAAACNPVMHAAVEEDRVHITGARAAPVIDAANAAYSLMLRCLARLYEVPSSRADLRQALLSAAMASMKAVSGLGTALTTLPARDGEDSPRGGMSFAMLRSIEGPLSGQAISSLVERLGEIAARLRELDLPEQVARPAAQALSAAAGRLKAAGS
jgi:hypothetical protein